MAFWASIRQQFSMILGIIFVAVFNEFGNDNFQLVVIQPRKYTYLQGITRNIVLCAFIEFWLLESRNADSETAGGPALLSINIFEQRLLRGSRLWPSAFGPSIYFLALFHRILGGRPPDNESQSPFSTFQCSFSGFRRHFPDSSLHSSASSPKAGKVESQGAPQARL